MSQAKIDLKFSSLTEKMALNKGNEKLVVMEQIINFASSEKVLKQTEGISIQRAFDIIINEADSNQNIDYMYNLKDQRYEFTTFEKPRLAIPENQLDLENLYTGAAGLIAHHNNISYIAALPANGWSKSFAKLMDSMHHIKTLAPSGKNDPRMKIVKSFDENEGVLSSALKECVSDTLEVYYLAHYSERQNSLLRDAKMIVSGLLGNVMEPDKPLQEDNDYVDWENVPKALGPV